MLPYDLFFQIIVTSFYSYGKLLSWLKLLVNAVKLNNSLY